MTVSQHTKEKTKGFTGTPCEKNKERHPKKDELNTEVDGLSTSECGRRVRSVGDDVAQYVSDVIDNRDCCVRCIGNQRQ